MDLDKLGEIALSENTTLEGLAGAEGECQRCPLYKNATQAVPGEGPNRVDLMIVGEQPGDQEDRAGRPFVGPAGQVLDRALADAGIDRRQAFVTNAVKHFKYEMRGKRRLHARPNTYEIERCRWWLEQERALVNPRVIVVLGVTAARSVLRKAVTIARVRGRPITISDREQAVVTVHPSALLRIEDASERADAYRRFVADLRQASHLLER
jgi:uracil-DNA glycosylase